MEEQGGGGRGAVTRAVWKRQHLLSFDSLWFGQVNGRLLGFPAALPVLWNIETDPAEDSWPSEKEGGYLQAESAIEDLGAPQVFPPPTSGEADRESCQLRGEHSPSSAC